jgi:hypothetical protein
MTNERTTPTEEQRLALTLASDDASSNPDPQRAEVAA